MSNPRYKIDALARGLEILTFFSTEKTSLSLTEIVTATKISKSTAFRILSTLETLKYLDRDPETRQYRPGLNVLQLGFTALSRLEVAQIGQLYLKALTEECGETTNMAVRDGKEIVYVVRNATWNIIGVNVQPGTRAPVHCTSMGKAQLIDLSPQELGNLMGDGPYIKMGPNTILYLKDLITELEKIRHQGYAVNDQELATGLRSVAAPVRNAKGNIVAAINISMPDFRISREELEEHLAPKVIETARSISLSLGALFA